MFNRLITLEELLPTVASADQPITSLTLVLANGEAVRLEGDELDSFNRVIHEGGQVLLADSLEEQPDPDPLVNPEIAAEILGVSRPTVYAWQDRGRLGLVQAGRVRCSRLREVLELRAQREANLAFQREIRQMPTPSDVDVERAAERFNGLAERLRGE